MQIQSIKKLSLNFHSFLINFTEIYSLNRFLGFLNLNITSMSATNLYNIINKNDLKSLFSIITFYWLSLKTTFLEIWAAESCGNMNLRQRKWILK